MKKLPFVLLGATLGLGVAACGAHLRRQPDPRAPEPFDPDLIQQQVSHSSRDAQILFLGDSITERWRFRSVLWNQLPTAANIGIGGARVGNLLWLVETGQLNVFHPRVVVVEVGTNDIGAFPPPFLERRRPSAKVICEGIAELTDKLHREFPQAKIVVMALPRRRGVLNEEVTELNRDLMSSRMEVYDPWGDGIVVGDDDIHLADEGYRRWSALMAKF